MKISREAKIGFSMVVAIFLFIWGLNFLKGKNLFNKTTHFYATFERIDGLKMSSPININGFKVGQVDEMTQLKNKNYLNLIGFYVEGDYSFPKGTKALLVSTDLMGSKAIELKWPENTTGIFQKANDTLDSGIEPGTTDLIANLEDKINHLLSEVDSIATSVNAILTDDFLLSVQSTMKNIENITESFDKELESGSIKNILTRVDKLTLSLNQQLPVISSTLENLNKTSASLANSPIDTMITSLNATITELHSIMYAVNDQQGSLGKLVYDDSLYLNLSSLSKSLDVMVKDITDHPKRYVHFSLFGKKE